MELNSVDGSICFGVVIRGVVMGELGRGVGSVRAAVFAQVLSA
jgi:hypothetical protein